MSRTKSSLPEADLRAKADELRLMLMQKVCEDVIKALGPFGNDGLMAVAILATALASTCRATNNPTIAAHQALTVFDDLMKEKGA